MDGQYDANSNFYNPPFRTPHHTCSHVALVGGGNPIKPGEVSLAHNGVLFLDEIPEFSRCVLESLREPLESGKIVISRAGQQADFPADFQLVAAMNPCPCGHYTHQTIECSCSIEKINRYRNKLSGPLLDRIDLQCHVKEISSNDLVAKMNEKHSISHIIRSQVETTQKIQLKRQGKLNAKLSPKKTENHCQISQSDTKYLIQALQKFQLSARGYHRLLRVARTIADMAKDTNINRCHIQQSLNFRQSV